MALARTLASPEGGRLQSLSLVGCGLTPESLSLAFGVAGLGGEGGTLKRTELPIPAWPSDHALLTAVYTPVPVIKPVLAAHPAEKNKCAVM
jgi:hypothetical protein